MYNIPPFIIIDDVKGVNGDGGNANGTRTAENLGITGLTIDILELIGDQLGCKFNYIYPCRKSTLAASGLCEGEEDILACTRPLHFLLKLFRSSPPRDHLTLMGSQALHARHESSCFQRELNNAAEMKARPGLCVDRNEWPVAEIDYANSEQALSLVKGDVNSLLFAGITPDFCPDELCFATGDLESPNSMPGSLHLHVPIEIPEPNLLERNHEFLSAASTHHLIDRDRVCHL